VEALVEVILPIFFVLGFGYAARWRGLITDAHVAGLMKFAQGFALPCLLFRAISTLDLAQDFDLRLLASFYAGAVTCFVIAFLAARHVFGRPWEDSVAIGFVGLFSNTLLLGLPITERAYGPGALAGNYAIIALHAPFCYGFGITVMEVVRHRGGGWGSTGRRVLVAMFRNALVLGIAAGFVVNLGHIPLPKVFTDAVDLMTRAALPAALFGLGATLFRYRPEGDLRIIAMLCAITLVLRPAITWGLGTALHLPKPGFRSAVLTAAMAPGVNAYLFSDMYGVGKRVAASTVLLATAGTVITAWLWLTALG
jgi:hypothetical protein